MSTLVFQVLTLLLAAFILGCLTGGMGRRLYSSVRQPAAMPSSEEEVALPSPRMDDASASVTNSPPEDDGDDLTRMDGIDQTAAERLNRLGIRHFHQIAALSDTEIDRIEAELGDTGRVRRQGWIEQARRFRDGESRPSE